MVSRGMLRNASKWNLFDILGIALRSMDQRMSFVYLTRLAII